MLKILWCIVGIIPQLHVNAAVSSDTLNGKVLFGYQGWFDTPSSGSGRGWVHWSSKTPSPDSCTFDLWPDVSEFSPTSLDNNTALYDKNGSPMALYASALEDVVDVHFRWMKEYGIDGVVVQRFVSELTSSSSKAYRDSVLTNAVVAAEKYGVVLSLMYDISGASAENWDDIIFSDWMYLTSNLSVTSSPSYLHHESKPVLFVWGIGFNDHVANADDSLTLINTLKIESYFIGGVPTHWRTCDGDSLPNFEEVYAAMDALTPWLVGRFSSVEEFDVILQNVVIPDSVLASSRGQGYAPNVWPGFSWYNLQNSNPDIVSPLNQIPRDSGKFWKHQFDSFVGGRLAAGSPLFIYGAMFDEFDESTAMAKAAPNLDALPTEGQFLHLSIDGVELPNDFYLQLAGDSTAIFRKKCLRRYFDPPTLLSPNVSLLSRFQDSSIPLFKKRAKSMSEQQLRIKLKRILSF